MRGSWLMSLSHCGLGPGYFPDPVEGWDMWGNLIILSLCHWQSGHDYISIDGIWPVAYGYTCAASCKSASQTHCAKIAAVQSLLPLVQYLLPCANRLIHMYIYIYSDHMTYDMYVTSKTNNLIAHMSYGFEVDVSIEALRCKCCVLETQGHSVELLAGGSC